LEVKSHDGFATVRGMKYSSQHPVPDLPIGLSLGPQDPRGPPTNYGTHRVNGRYMII